MKSLPPLPDRQPEPVPDLFDRPDEEPDEEPDEPPAEAAQDQTREPVVHVVGDSDAEIAAAINSDAARKSWVDAILPLLQKGPPRAGENRTVRAAYDCAIIAVYDRMTRLMRSDLAEPTDPR